MGSALRVAIHAFATPPQMVVFGAIDFSAVLARIATEIGYRVRSSTRARRSLRARASASTLRSASRGRSIYRRQARPARRRARLHARRQVRRPA
jgi:hypothetical protein